ncbi:MAG: hypothetical protein ACR2MQ_02805 [Gemmatimonadaceae bacterium]
MRKFALVAVSMFAPLILCAQNAPEMARAIVVPEGTEFTVVTADELNGKSATRGDIVKLAMAAPLAVDNTVVVSKDAYVRGQVGDVKRAGHFGKGGRMSLTVTAVTATDGQHIPVRASKSKAGKDHTGATVALVLFTGGLGLLKHGNDVVYKAGTEIQVFTDSTVTVHVPVVASATPQ